jgi:predicted RNase H-like nuclease (RuvC/YqgF family)
MSRTISFTARLPKEHTNRMLEARIRKLEKQVALLENLEDLILRNREDIEDADNRVWELERADRDVERLESRIENIEDALRSASSNFDI